LKSCNILLIDNYDSFTYNLKHYIEETGAACRVMRNDSVGFSDAEKADALVLSPGPGLPEESGMLLPIIEKYLMHKKMLGICLGHQAMAIATAGKLKQLSMVMHGIMRPCFCLESDPVLVNIPQTFFAGRYHSWTVDRNGLSPEWKILAEDDSREIMIMKHKQYNAYGMQFHPESVMTNPGRQLIRNWINL
jgi:anthranilate synthase component II